MEAELGRTQMRCDITYAPLCRGRATARLRRAWRNSPRGV